MISQSPTKGTKKNNNDDLRTKKIKRDDARLVEGNCTAYAAGSPAPLLASFAVNRYSFFVFKDNERESRKNYPVDFLHAFQATRREIIKGK